MTDEEIVAEIDRLSAEVQLLREQGAGGKHEGAEQIRHLEERIDQLWDLRRQRDARREYGKDPAGAQERPVDEVEHYRQ